MRVIDAKKLLATLAHQTLSCEQIFRRSFISDERVRRYIPQTIDRAGASLARAAYQAAALRWTSFARVRVHLFDVRAKKGYGVSGVRCRVPVIIIN